MTSFLWHLHRYEPTSRFPPASPGYLLGLFFDPEDEGDMFLQNVLSLCELHAVATQKAVRFIAYRL
jgi:hypothetical protein